LKLKVAGKEKKKLTKSVRILLQTKNKNIFSSLAVFLFLAFSSIYFKNDKAHKVHQSQSKCLLEDTICPTNISEVLILCQGVVSPKHFSYSAHRDARGKGSMTE
jgi:hypothetical protein